MKNNCEENETKKKSMNTHLLIFNSSLFLSNLNYFIDSYLTYISLKKIEFQIK